MTQAVPVDASEGVLGRGVSPAMPPMRREEDLRRSTPLLAWVPGLSAALVRTVRTYDYLNYAWGGRVCRQDRLGGAAGLLGVQRVETRLGFEAGKRASPDR